jgi:hypothetical protein
MERTAEFHHQIADTLLPPSEPIFDNTTAFDTAVHVLDPQPAIVESLVDALLLHGQLLAPGFLGGHEDLHLRECERQEAQVLQQPPTCRSGIRRRVSNGLIMSAAAIGVTEEEDKEQGLDQQDIFYRMIF